jgi:hypothetical protein
MSLATSNQISDASSMASGIRWLGSLTFIDRPCVV